MATSITAAQQTAISELYVAFFGRAADSEGLGFWAGALAGGKSIETIAQDMYLTAPARAYYSTALTNEQFINAFYTTVLNRATPDAEGVAFWTAALNQPNATQGSVAVEIMKAVRDYVDTPSSATNAAALTAKALFAAKVDVSTAYALQGGTAVGATDVLTGVVDAATATAAITGLTATATVGKTFTFTAGLDTLTGTSGNDTFIADNTDINKTQLSVADSINGGSGTDTLKIYSKAGEANVLPTMTGIEALYLNGGNGTKDSTTIAATTGVTSLTVDAQVTAAGTYTLSGQTVTLQNSEIGRAHV